MSNNNKPRDIRHEMADVIAILGDEYTTTNVECDPGDTAIKITRQNSDKILYIIAYSNPADTEIHLYEGHDSLSTYHVFYDGSINDHTPEEIADYITKNL